MVRRDRDPHRLPVAREAGQRRVEALQCFLVAADHAAVERRVRLHDGAFRAVGRAELLLQRQRSQRQPQRLGHLAEVALDGGEVRRERRQLSDVAERFGVVDRLLEREPGVAQPPHGVQHVGVVGPEAAALLRVGVSFDEGAIALDHRQRLGRAAGLRQADRVQTRRVEAGPGRIESARERGRLDRRRDADRVIGGHERGGGLGRQRGGALLGGFGRRQQRVDDAVRMGDAVHDDQRVDALAARVERERGCVGAVEGVAGAAPALDFVRALRRFAGAPCRAGVGVAGRSPFGRARPVRRDAVRQRLVRDQVQGDAPMQQLGDRPRHRLAGRLEDQVVRERAVADHLRRLELAPGLGEVERVALEHRRSELGSEVGAGERSDAREAQRVARQLAEAPLDQRPDAHRLRQRRDLCRRAGVTREDQVLQRLEREHRIAAGVLQQRRRQVRDVELGQAERFDQERQLRLVERLQFDRLDAACFFERSPHRRRRAARFAASLREAPVQRGERVGLDQGLQELDARLVGEVQVVDDDRVQFGGRRIDERSVDRAVQQEPLRLAGECHRRAQLGQHDRELLRALGAQRDRVRGEQGAQQAREHGVGDARVAGAGANGDDAGAAGRELVQQPALADARLADEQEDTPRRPGVIERGDLFLAADEARWADEARRHDRASCRQRRGAALDRRQQLDRLG